MKMPTIVGIYMFISRENFMVSQVEHENSFVTSGSGRIFKGNGNTFRGDSSVKIAFFLPFTLKRYMYSLRDPFSEGI